MSIFATIGGWFKKQEAAVEKLFHRIEPLVEKAEPIVEEIAAVAASAAAGDPASPEAATLHAVSGYLTKAVGVESVVDAFVKANQNAPLNNVLHNAATLALQYTHGEASSAVSDIDTAVQLAYSTYKQTSASAAQ